MNWQSGLSSLLVALALTATSSCEKPTKKWHADVYGHAGAGLSPERWVYPENTDKSIMYALDALNADGVEVDVRFSKDSVAILYHDDRLEAHTNGSGCIEELTLAEIKELEYYSKYTIVELKDVVDMCQLRNKRLMVDVKSLNTCTGQTVNYDLMNKAFQDAFVGLDYEAHHNITINARSLDLLAALEDSIAIKSYETEDVAAGIAAFESWQVEMLVIKLDALTEADANYLYTNDIPFTIFDIKVQKDIKQAYYHLPTALITDNIAYTKKIMR